MNNYDFVSFDLVKLVSH